MATTLSITSTYAGEVAGKYIYPALIGSPTIYNGGVMVNENVRWKMPVRRLSLDDIVKDATCDFDPTSTITQTERILTTEEFQVNLNLCKSTFRTKWEAIEQGFGMEKGMPKTFQEYLMKYVMEKVAAKNETTIWQGVDASAGEYDGFLTLFASDSDVIDVTGATVTATNVITELGAVVDAIPQAIIDKDDLNIYIPKNVMQAYIRALGGFGSSGLGAAGLGSMGPMWYNGQGLSYENYNLFYAPGLPADTIVAAQKSNLWFGTGLLSDANSIKIVDTSETLADDNVRFAMKYTAGIQYGFGAEIVYRTTP